MINSLTTKKQTTNFLSANFKKNVKFKLYHTETSKTTSQTVQILMRWLIISHLIKIYAVCKFNYFVSGSTETQYRSSIHFLFVFYKNMFSSIILMSLLMSINLMSMSSGKYPQIIIKTNASLSNKIIDRRH